MGKNVKPEQEKQAREHNAKILDVLSENGLLFRQVEVPRKGYIAIEREEIITPAFVRVGQQYELHFLNVPAPLFQRVRALAPQFALVLDCGSVGVEAQDKMVVVRVPIQAEGRGVLNFLDVLPGENMGVGNVLLGVDEKGDVLKLDMTKPENTHAAVVGMTGSGKSSLMHTMATSAILHRTGKVALLDPSRGLEFLSGHPLIWRGGLFGTPEECELALWTLAGSVYKPREQPILVFVDEVPDLIAMDARIADHLARIAQAGRNGNIHLVMGAQEFTAGIVGQMVARNTGVRLVGSVTDPHAASNATGRKSTRAQDLQGAGDFLLVRGTLQTRFQAPLVSETFKRDFVERFGLRAPRVPVRAQAKKATPVLDPTGGPGRPLDDIPDEVVEAIQEFAQANGDPPTVTGIYHMTKQMYGEGFGRDKARRALEAAGYPAESTVTAS